MLKTEKKEVGESNDQPINLLSPYHNQCKQLIKVITVTCLQMKQAEKIQEYCIHLKYQFLNKIGEYFLCEN